MNRAAQPPFSTIAMISLALCCHALHADQTARTDDGRDVLLRDDGRWEYAGDAPLHARQQLNTSQPAVALHKTVIEKHITKVQKNKRVSTQTVFYLTVELSRLAGSGMTFGNDDAAGIEVTDNNGRHYPVLYIRYDTKTLQPGANTGIAVRVDGSPSWLDDAESMALTLKPGIFGIREPVTLSRKIDDFEVIAVDGFETRDRE